MPDALLDPVVPVVPANVEPTVTPQTPPTVEPVVDPAAPKVEPTVQVKPVVPEKYDLKLPEGSQLESDYVAQISAYAKERGMSNEQAQEILNRESGLVSSFASKQMEKFNQTVDEWAKATESDKEIGGPNVKQNIEMANRVIKRFATPEFSKGLVETGFGNHPEFVRIFTRIGKAMSEDQLVVRGSEPAPTKSVAETLYGSNKP